MDQTLTNTASALGTYSTVPTTITSDENSVTMVSGLTITKAADKTVWAEGPLTYTITVTNNASSTYSSVVLTDMINTTLVKFIEGSVTIGGTATESGKVNYDSSTGKLDITLDDIDVNEYKVVTFQVEKN